MRFPDHFPAILGLHGGMAKSRYFCGRVACQSQHNVQTIANIHLPFTIPAVLPRLFALSAFALTGIALNFLLPACHAGLRHPLPGLSCLGHTPLAIHRFTIDHGRKLRPIVVQENTALSWESPFAH